MDDAHRQQYLRERYSSDELIAELDRRLEEQGVDMSLGNIQMVVDYLREGWSLLAFPPEIAERISGMTATPQSIAVLGAELRHMIAQQTEATAEGMVKAEPVIERVAEALYENHRQSFWPIWRDIQITDDGAMKAAGIAKSSARALVGIDG